MEHSEMDEDFAIDIVEYFVDFYTKKEVTQTEKNDHKS